MPKKNQYVEDFNQRLPGLTVQSYQDEDPCEEQDLQFNLAKDKIEHLTYIYTDSQPKQNKEVCKNTLKNCCWK